MARHAGAPSVAQPSAVVAPRRMAGLVIHGTVGQSHGSPAASTRRPGVRGAVRRMTTARRRLDAR